MAKWTTFKPGWDMYYSYALCGIDEKFLIKKLQIVRKFFQMQCNSCLVYSIFIIKNSKNKKGEKPELI